MSLVAPGSPKKPVQEVSQEQYRERNRLVCFGFCSFLLGLATAIYLGAVAQARFQEIPVWLSAIASIGATVVSVVAVYWVSQTLKATREALVLTQEMAIDQKRIGEAQIRPFILFEREFYVR
ncbi:hypothetical protein [Phaeobacter inhibens]|uniref:hypothetical protein n=1 Tax=Phaeobacter inhibens TaxID=221822 RepID=UPI0021A553E5|nr:hypothetical protein [Phaeobacter inhibens]UWR87115.1 hypothetical protein K4L01_10015 [Phaeobacter inhibens]